MSGSRIPRIFLQAMMLGVIAAAVMLAMFYGQYRWMARQIVTAGSEEHRALVEAGLREVHVSPRMVYVDASRPALVEGFTRNTFAAMVAGVRAETLARDLLDQATFDQGIADLYRTAEPDGVFIYTFYKATASRPFTSMK